MGTNIKIASKRLFDFSKLSGSDSQEIVLFKALPAYLYREATLQLRYHGNNGTAWTSGQEIDAILRAEGFTEDPNTDFVYGTALATAPIYSGTTAPAMVIQVAQFGGNPGNFGGYLRVVLKGIQAASPATLQAYLSIDVTLKA